MRLPFELLHQSGFPKYALSDGLKWESNRIVDGRGFEIAEIDQDIVDRWERFQDQPDEVDPELELHLLWMAEEGLLSSQRQEAYTWLDVVSHLSRHVPTRLLQAYNRTSILYHLAHGTAPAEGVRAWIIKCFQYTHSAYRHISAIIENTQLSPDHRTFWKAFRADEAHHWRMYRPIFDFLGIDIYETAKKPIDSDVEEFIRVIERAGRASMAQYGAILYMMEMGPAVTELESDPQFGALINHYGYPKEVVEPLWAHTQYNHDSGHSDIWMRVLRSKPSYSEAEFKAICSAVDEHLEASFKWNKI